MKLSKPVPAPAPLSDAPADYLREAAKLFRASHRPIDPVWKKRMRGWWVYLKRTTTIELTADFRLRVRDPKSGQILAESEPGQIDVLRPSVPTSRP